MTELLAMLGVLVVVAAFGLYVAALAFIAADNAAKREDEKAPNALWETDA